MLVNVRIRLPDLRINRLQLRSQRLGTIREPRLHQRKMLVKVDGNHRHRLAGRWFFVLLKEVELRHLPTRLLR